MQNKTCSAAYLVFLANLLNYNMSLRVIIILCNINYILYLYVEVYTL